MAPKIPSYRLHRPTGLGVVRLNGRDIYLGEHGTPESKGKYERVIGEWLSNGRQLQAATAAASGSSTGATIAELAAAYWIHAEGYYKRPDGTCSKEIESIRQALKPLLRLYTRCPAADFGPLKLKSVRESMIQLGWSRKSINKHTQRIVRMFKWCASCEMIPADIHQSLRTVEGLREGRSSAKESQKVQKVADEAIDAVKPFLSNVVRDMVSLQRFTGMRSGELVTMRPCDIDTGADDWIYRPHHHKTAHHGHSRIIPLGPKAKEILQPYLGTETPLQGFIFSPAKAVRKGPKQRKSRCRGAERLRGPGAKYTVATYRRAIARACDDAFPVPAELQADDEKVKQWKKDAWKAHKRPGKLDEMTAEVRAAYERVEAARSKNRWHPHQIRHTAATEFRAKYGIEKARIVLGHRSASVTEIYAEVDIGTAVQIMREVG